MRRKKKIKILSLVAVAVSIILISCITLFSSHPETMKWQDETMYVSVTEEQIPETTAPDTVLFPEFPDEVLLCSAEAKQVYDGALSMAEAASSGDPYRPLVISYRFKSGSGSLLLCEHPDMQNAVKYILDQENTSITIDNLKTDTTYYYQVTAEGTSYSGSFHTAKSFRFVSLPGAVNTRDIGGYTNLDGKKIRQGLLIRGSELDGLEETRFFLRDDAIASVKETFSFVYDLDLRNPHIYIGEYQSRLGEEVGHRFYDGPQYGGIFQSYYTQRLRQAFVDLADPEKYPMYLHCTYGADRTGTVIFLLQGLLNMSQEDMCREYQLTAFERSGFLEQNGVDVIINGLNPYPGETLQEKIEYFLTWEIGVKQSAIQSIREIYLE